MSLNWSVIGAIAALSIGAVTAYVYLLIHRRLKQAESDWWGRHAAMEAELRVLCASAREGGDRVLSLEQESRRLGDAVNRLEMKRAPPSSHYRHAIALAARGATAEELVTSCGLARGEAELMQRVHQENS